MAVVLVTGFEWPGVATPTTTGGGLCSQLTVGGGTITTVTSPVRSGSRALQISCTDATSMWWGGPTWAATAVCAVGLAVRFSDLVSDSSTPTFLELGPASGGSVWAQLRINGSGVVEYRANTAAGWTTGPTLSLDTWYWLSLLYDTTTNTHTLDVAVDGTAYAQASYSAGSSSVQITTLWLEWLGQGSAQSATAYYDDVIVTTGSTGDHPIDRHAVLSMAPSGAAEHQAITLSQWQYTDNFSSWTNFAGQTETDSATRLDDLTAGTDGIRMNATGAVAGNGRWAFSDPSPGGGYTPTAARTIIVAREASTGTNNAIFRILDGSSTANVFNGNPGWGTTWNYLALMSAAPPSGGSWDDSKVNGLKFEADSTDASPDVWLGGVVCEVAYAESAADTAVPYVGGGYYGGEVS